MFARNMIACIASAALAIASIYTETAFAGEARVHYAKTEVEKANSACVILMLVGGLGGAAIGRKRGALIGVGITALLCVILQANARNKDRILAAEAATVQNRRDVYQETFQDDQGRNVTFSGRRGESQTVDATQLLPVKYKSSTGSAIASPVMASGGQECRAAAGSLTYETGQSANLPAQVFCRTPEGDWEPYAVKKT